MAGDANFNDFLDGDDVFHGDVIDTGARKGTTPETAMASANVSLGHRDS